MKTVFQLLISVSLIGAFSQHALGQAVPTITSTCSASLANGAPEASYVVPAGQSLSIPITGEFTATYTNASTTTKLFRAAFDETLSFGNQGLTTLGTQSRLSPPPNLSAFSLPAGMFLNVPDGGPDTYTLNVSIGAPQTFRAGASLSAYAQSADGLSSWASSHSVSSYTR